MTMHSQHARGVDAQKIRLWNDVAAVGLLVVVVSLIYGARLERLPLVGEETRWASGAREMLATGDWIVPRQQGQVFAERPPMTMWAMALMGRLRGDVDAVAVRLPSVIAVVLTSLLVYGYARLALPYPLQGVAIAAGLVYATLGQVLQIGRFGESEALFALLVSGSLLVWHLGYLRGWRRLATWSIGFGCAALAALVKGPQAPVYFIAITAVYLAVRHDWRYLFGWQFAAGAAVFAGIVALWQVPFYLATDGTAVVATWSGLAADRLHLAGFAKHVVAYPLETFACLLPWSPLLVALVKRETRAALADERDVTTFLITAIVVAYPTVWLAAGARGRYFMPLYPLAAVLIGLLIQRLSQATVGYPRRAWRQFLVLWSVMIGVGGLVIAGGGLLTADWINALHQPRWFSLLFGIMAICASALLILQRRGPQRFRPIVAVGALAGVTGLAYTGLMINVNAARWHDPRQLVAELRNQLPPAAKLVSLTPIEHRFAYYYDAPIAELDWPLDITDLPAEVDYFCFMRHPGDTAASRAAGRGRSWTTAPGTLPFAWEEISTFCIDRRVRDRAQPMVVIARVVRPLRAMVTDATVPQGARTSSRGVLGGR